MYALVRLRDRGPSGSVLSFRDLMQGVILPSGAAADLLQFYLQYMPPSFAFASLFVCVTES
jgi:hypothetical protein